MSSWDEQIADRLAPLEELWYDIQNERTEVKDRLDELDGAQARVEAIIKSAMPGMMERILRDTESEPEPQKPKRTRLKQPAPVRMEIFPDGRMKRGRQTVSAKRVDSIKREAIALMQTQGQATVREIAEQTNIGDNVIGLVMGGFRQHGVFRLAGKKGNKKIYKLTEANDG